MDVLSSPHCVSSVVLKRQEADRRQSISLSRSPFQGLCACVCALVDLTLEIPQVIGRDDSGPLGRAEQRHQALDPPLALDLVCTKYRIHEGDDVHRGQRVRHLTHGACEFLKMSSLGLCVCVGIALSSCALVEASEHFLCSLA